MVKPPVEHHQKCVLMSRNACQWKIRIVLSIYTWLKTDRELLTMKWSPVSSASPPSYSSTFYLVSLVLMSTTVINIRGSLFPGYYTLALHCERWGLNALTLSYLLLLLIYILLLMRLVVPVAALNNSNFRVLFHYFSVEPLSLSPWRRMYWSALTSLPLSYSFPNFC